MISVSNNYKNHVINNNSFSSKNKIVVDGVEYLGDKLKTYPKVSHSSTKICGSFPSKTVSFEIYDLNNELDFVGKEIEVYKGLVVDGDVEYVKQGIFIPQKENITTSISNRTIKIENAPDRSQFLDDIYESNLDWSTNHTGLEIVNEICTKKGLTLKSESFNFTNYSFRQPNFPSNITYREVLSRIAEIGGEIVIFDSNGYLEIKSQFITGDTFNRSKYVNLSKEKQITYNSVVLGKKGINDDIKYPTNMLDDNRVSKRIEDNPFVDLYREDMIEDVAQYLIGFTYVPFEIKNITDGYMYELNDVINVIDRNNETLRAVITSIKNTSRIQSDISLSTKNSDTTNYKLAGSNQQSLANVLLNVDHINNQITEVVSKTEQLEQSIDILSADLDSNIIVVSTDGSNKPFQTKSYTIIFTNKYLGTPIYIVPTTENSYTGISVNATNSAITFSVSNNTAIQNTDNKYIFTWSHTDSGGNTNTVSKAITLTTIQSESEQNIIMSDTAPSDTSVLWFNTEDNNIYVYDEEESEWVVVNDYTSQIQDVESLIIGENGVNTKINSLDSQVKSNTNELQNKLDSSAFNTFQTQYQSEIGNYYKKDEIQQIVNGTGVDGVTVSAVVSTTGTFDSDGMHYQKSTSDTISTINHEGVRVDDSNNNELFFAGVRSGESKSTVESNKLNVKDELTVGNNKGMFKEFTDTIDNISGVGFFLK